MKKTIEIDDCLPDHVESAIDDIKVELENYLDENTPTTCPDWGDLDYSGALHGIIDGAVPIYTHDIEAAWFLYGSEIESAYQDAGIGDNPRENSGMTALYCYIESKAQEWWSENAEPIFEAWETRREFRADLERLIGEDWEAKWLAYQPNSEERRALEENAKAEDLLLGILGA